VIAETEELKSALIAERRLRPERIQVVSLGVDHARFRPLSRNAARAELGLSNDALIMLYVGGMDQYHDLSPLLAALGHVAPAQLELHLVGDGAYSGRYRDLAKGSTARVRFHGQVGHAVVPTFIAASDVCLAPYQTSGFHGGQVSFSTLKIPEYMACERPVISVPSGNILTLIEDGVSGFLFPNELAAWRSFLTALPDRARFAEMGRVAAPKVASLSWSATACRYLQTCSAAIGRDLL
jgi:glycosyltransferase involved in cell wall biosynthesis